MSLSHSILQVGIVYSYNNRSGINVELDTIYNNLSCCCDNAGHHVLRYNNYYCSITLNIRTLCV